MADEEKQQDRQGRVQMAAKRQRILAFFSLVLTAICLICWRSCTSTPDALACTLLPSVFDLDAATTFLYLAIFLIICFLCCPCMAIGEPREFYEWIPQLKEPMQRRFGTSTSVA